MPLSDVAGRAYGPVAFEVTGSALADFVAATGDDRGRWRDHAPPGYAGAVLFVVAPSFLGDPDVAGEARSVIHTEQVFSWHRALSVGEELEVSGRVAGVRVRGALNRVSFDLAAGGEAGPWLDGSATFLMSAEAASAADPEPEPAHDAVGDNRGMEKSPLPARGEELPVMQRSASRADLVRYAGATGDWNPIHWDHEAATGAGLPGIVVHGLLMASWLAQAAARHVPGAHPLSEMAVRFRRPLRPARQAEVSGEVGDDGRISLALAAGEDVLVSATARVTA